MRKNFDGLKVKKNYVMACLKVIKFFKAIKAEANIFVAKAQLKAIASTEAICCWTFNKKSFTKLQVWWRNPQFLLKKSFFPDFFVHFLTIWWSWFVLHPSFFLSLVNINFLRSSRRLTLHVGNLTLFLF